MTRNVIKCRIIKRSSVLLRFLFSTAHSASCGRSFFIYSI
nr:MAG TPA: hypothetical protein [Caudoviricetes sp.]